MFSVFLAKLLNFVVTIIVIKLLTKEEYGLITYSITIIAFLLPFVGAGLFQGLLRFGAIVDGQIHKKVLFNITFWKGLTYTVLMSVMVILLTPVITKNLPDASIYLIVLSFQLVTLFIFKMIQIYNRLIHRNKLFAYVDIQNNLLLLVSSVSLCYFFGGIGYIVSIISIPLLLGVFYLYKLNLIPLKIAKDKIAKIKKSFDFNFKEIFSYGLYMSLGGVLSQLLYAIDILLIGNLLINAESVAQYKASSIIPFSLLMLAQAVMTTDFVKLANASKNDKASLKNYYLNYLKIFSFVSIGIIIFFYFFSDDLLKIFGTAYQGHARLMFIFSVGIVGAILFRIPMGNMLSAIGWPKINALFSVIVLILNVVGGYYMILNYGIEGAAITTAVLMWVSGFFSLGAFIFYLKR